MGVSVTTVKKYLQKDLGDFLKKYNFNIRRISGDIYFSKKEGSIGYSFFAFISSRGYITLNAASIGYYQVERIIAKIAKYEMIEYDEHPYLTTLRLFYPQSSTIVESEDDFYRIVTEFETSFITYYLPTFEKYSDPKNVLELWDSLPTMRSKADNFPSPDNYSKILILSKMCNDENYQKRIDETIRFFQGEIDRGEDWMQVKLDVFLKVVKYLEENEI